MAFSRFATGLAIFTLASPSASAAPRVDPTVHRTLRQRGTVDLIVTLKQGTSPAINAAHETAFATREANIEALVNQLEAHAITSQAELTKAVSEEVRDAEFEYSKRFWISNQVYFKGASFVLVEKLARLSSISEVREEIVRPLPELTVTETENMTGIIRPLANQYGINKIQADKVWEAGFTGQGVIVGTIDTGVMYTHEAVKANWRSEHGWFDPGAGKPMPYDDSGHGTHTMGTIAGSGGIGVAPGATWISCRGCTRTSCTDSDLLTCAQFMTCPTDADGNKKDCSQAPHVVSNSWSGGHGDSFFQVAVDAWHAAGIIPIFSHGNEGPLCGTVNSPGDYANVIAIGATDSSDGLAWFSGKGPSTEGLVKPEVSTPGVGVRSAWNAGDSEYNTISGTSMAHRT